MLKRNGTMAASMILVAALLAAGAGGCSNAEVGSTWAARAAAAPLGTSFMWMPDRPSRPGSGGAVDPRVQQMIRETVAAGFIAKGYVQKAEPPADFWIACRMVKDVRGDAYSLGAFDQYTEGSIVVYVVDPQAQDWVWKAWAEARLDPSSPPETKRQRLQQVVKDMLSQFPAVGGKAR